MPRRERRLQAVVDLQLINLESGGSVNRSADIATVERQVGLRNAGPRPGEVLSASVGSLCQVPGSMDTENCR